MKSAFPRNALLLLGPTGSGKSPLGNILEERTGRPHFDFGHELRVIAEGRATYGLSEGEREFVAGLLRAHALFPDDKFSIVKKIVESFLNQHPQADGIILNGMPRHVGQAIAIEPMLRVTDVVVLSCSPDIAAARVEKRSKGLSNDHSGRPDDTPDAVRRKIEIFERETRPLIEHYRSQGARVTAIEIETDSDEAGIAATIDGLVE